MKGMSESSGMREDGQQRPAAGAGQALAEHEGDAGAQEREGQAGDDLVGLEVDGDDPVEGGQHGAREPWPGRRPTQASPVSSPTRKPTRAPTNIMPCTPRLMTPARSAKSSPMAAKSRTVPALDAGRERQLEVHRRATRTR